MLLLLLLSVAHGYVQADVVNTRAAPRAKAAVVMRLRIGTGVAILERKGDWSKTEHGWIQSAYLGEKRTTLAAALTAAQAARDAGDVETEILWRERAVAIDGTKADEWRALADAYHRAERTKDEKRALDVLADRVPVYFAACHEDRIVLLARRDERHDYEAASDRPASELRRFEEELLGLPWFSISFGAPQAILGTPVVKIERKPEGGTDDVRMRLDLGPCPGLGSPALLFTAPMTAAGRAAAATLDRIAAYTKALALERTPMGVEIFAVPGTPVFEAVFTVDDHFARELFDAKGKRLKTAERHRWSRPRTQWVRPYLLPAKEAPRIGLSRHDWTQLDAVIPGERGPDSGPYGGDVGYEIDEVDTRGDLRSIDVAMESGGC